MKKRAMLICVAIILPSIVGYCFFRTQGTQFLAWISGQPFYAGQPSSYWIAAVNEQPDKTIQQLAEGNAQAVPVALKMLNDKEVSVRRSAVACLDRIGVEEPTVFSGLCARISVETAQCGRTDSSFNARDKLCINGNKRNA